MTDERLRAAERRSGTSAFDAAVALLSERLRAGLVDVDRARLAAYCGHEAARGALGAGAPVAPDDVEGWVRGLEAWGSEVAVRGYAAAADEDEGDTPAEREQARRTVAAVMRHADAAKLRSGASALIDEMDAIFDDTTRAANAREMNELPNSPHRKVLYLVVRELANDPRYITPQDPEIVRATGLMQARLDWTRGRVVYGRTERSEDHEGRWAHQFKLVEPDGAERWPRTQVAAEGWSPPHGSERFPPGSRGVFTGYVSARSFRDPATAQARARRALAAWALSAP